MVEINYSKTPEDLIKQYREIAIQVDSLSSEELVKSRDVCESYLQMQKELKEMGLGKLIKE